MNESTQTQYPAEWDSIPEQPALPQGGSQLEGPGISSDLEKCKAADLIDENFAVIGYAKYESKEEAGQFFAYVEILTPSNERFKFSTSSSVLMGKLKQRYDLGQIPFRTGLVMKDSKKTAGRTYYDFLD